MWCGARDWSSRARGWGCPTDQCAAGAHYSGERKGLFHSSTSENHILYYSFPLMFYCTNGIARRSVQYYHSLWESVWDERGEGGWGAAAFGVFKCCSPFSRFDFRSSSDALLALSFFNACVPVIISAGTAFVACFFFFASPVIVQHLCRCRLFARIIKCSWTCCMFFVVVFFVM